MSSKISSPYASTGVGERVQPSVAVTPRTVSSAATTEHEPLFNLFRVLGAVGVIWVHVSHYLPRSGGRTLESLGRFAVPFFTASAIFFAIQSLWRKPDLRFTDHLRRRVSRLYAPFLAWTVVYLALQFARQSISGTHGEITLGLQVFWNGGDYHLWFLPFILVATLAMFPVARALRDFPPLAGVVMCLMLGFASSLLRSQPAWAGERWGILRLGVEQLPSMFVGIVFACAMRKTGGLGPKVARPELALVGLALLIGAMAGVYLTGRSALLEGAAALGCMLVCVSRIRPAGLSLVASLGQWSFGIYLSHLLFVGAIRTVAIHYRVDTTVWFAVIATILAFIAGAFVTRLLWNTRRLRWMVA